MRGTEFPADGSWLLGCELSGGESLTVDGRHAYRLTVAGSFWRSRLLMFSYPAIAVVDAETGRLLRLTTYGKGEPAFCYELRDAAPPAGRELRLRDATGLARCPGGFPR